MFFKKKGFTLVELMVSLVLSAIIVFFAYTLIISAYKMFSKVSKTSNNFNSPQFFEEFFRRSLADASSIDLGNSQKITINRYDPLLDKTVHDTYSFEGKGVQFTELTGTSHQYFDSVPTNIPVGKNSANLIVRSTGAGLKIEDVVLLSNVRAFYYRVDKINPSQPHLKNIMVGVLYDDYIVPGIPKRQYKTFCFTLRRQELTI